MRVAPVQDGHMDADPGTPTKRLEEVPGQAGVEGADERGHASWLTVHHVRPAGEVDRRPDQGLVERDHGVTEPADAGLVTERLAQRLAKRNRRILDGVVRVHLDVTGRLDA